LVGSWLMLSGCGIIVKEFIYGFTVKKCTFLKMVDSD